MIGELIRRTGVDPLAGAIPPQVEVEFMAGVRIRQSGVQLGDYDITAYARAFGAHGYRLDGPAQFASTLERALAENGVSIIDAPVDYSHSTDIAAQLHEEVLI
ncbi:Thiamine pyrophosphate enzyme, C-terminal TPP binding domain [Asanoa hainanensis]|uniref:Thiamine pyrophosphate enzyme, C-terminal TPP binding domain n=1 Tax=Asanoa hainanensis TaxID=560556 RepID=A0A239JY37_9ACTN|nr:thiamine pyrophosphate-dependent enzyme [Asanoa hainanensis]SNT10398.1 Thiamine pyrophosphate enzyme, C-terminal TPP binding domain [Asanoa hainanensis]